MKKKETKIPPVGRKDTKFIEGNFKNIKVDIKNDNNDNSNSK